MERGILEFTVIAPMCMSHCLCTVLRMFSKRPFFNGNWARMLSWRLFETLKGFTGVARNNCSNWATWWFLQSMGSMFSSQQVQCNIHCNCRLWRVWGFQMLHGLVLRKGKHEECFPRGREEWRGGHCQGEQSSSLSRNPVSDPAHHFYTTLCFIYCDPSQESDHWVEY